MFLPEIMRLRIPQVIYQSSNDGYQLSNVYRKCAEYAESYSACTVLIEAEDGYSLWIEDNRVESYDE